MTDPGLHPHMTNADYHAHEDWVSSSMLKALLPEHYKTGGSPEALAFGTLVHEAVLEPHLLDAYVALDAAKIGVKFDGTPAQSPTMTAAWKRAVADVEADGKQVIAQSDLDTALAMRDAIMRHDTARRLLYADDRRVEESAFAVVDGVQCRARFDVRLPGGVVDLKSTSAKPGRRSLERTIVDYGYDLSAAHYLAVAQELDLNARAFSLVFVVKSEPYYVTVVDLDETFLDRGRVLRQRTIDRFTARADAYEGATGYLTLNCPRWAEIGGPS